MDKDCSNDPTWAGLSLAMLGLIAWLFKMNIWAESRVIDLKEQMEKQIKTMKEENRTFYHDEDKHLMYECKKVYQVIDGTPPQIDIMTKEDRLFYYNKEYNLMYEVDKVSRVIEGLPPLPGEEGWDEFVSKNST